MTQKPNPLPFRQVGRYNIVREIARGAMGVVFLAQEAHTQMYVALKVMLSADSATGQARFRQEAQLAGQLNHPNIVRIMDYGEFQGMEYFVMEFIQGHSLKQYIKTHAPFSPEQAFRTIHPILSAVHYAHEQNIIHRDLKAQNIIVDQRGQPRITDFGIAKNLDSDEALTQAGSVVGTPTHLAPEQIQLKKPDRRVDIYQIGIMLFEMLTAKLPYRGNMAEKFAAILSPDIPSLQEANSNVPEMVEQICHRAIAKDPELRYQTAEDFAHDLEGYIANPNEFQVGDGREPGSGTQRPQAGGSNRSSRISRGGPSGVRRRKGTNLRKSRGDAPEPGGLSKEHLNLIIILSVLGLAVIILVVMVAFK